MPRFVEKGHSAVLKCDYTLSLNELYKVEWRRNGRKVFQFIKGRRPPFRNFTMPGGTVDVSKLTFSGMIARRNAWASAPSGDGRGRRRTTRAYVT
ncbi:UNVERIFIED_CONTAM: hypothetical protein PYX00_001765 [Menopon gallinae]|uniref:Ig-like domain-containing protein n=1 Tax=Menopon gallinae TaxID=328185 RepID=A0AAW2IG99_9NEOP